MQGDDVGCDGCAVNAGEENGDERVVSQHVLPDEEMGRTVGAGISPSCTTIGPSINIIDRGLVVATSGDEGAKLFGAYANALIRVVLHLNVGSCHES